MKNLISLGEVCLLASCSQSTIYYRLKNTSFPKPQKIPATAIHGPRAINRWVYSEVNDWLLAGNDPRWTKHRKKELLAEDIEPRLQEKHMQELRLQEKLHQESQNKIQKKLQQELRLQEKLLREVNTGKPSLQQSWLTKNKLLLAGGSALLIAGVGYFLA